MQQYLQRKNCHIHKYIYVGTVVQQMYIYIYMCIYNSAKDLCWVLHKMQVFGKN